MPWCWIRFVFAFIVCLGWTSLSAQSPGGVSGSLDFWLKANVDVEEAASDTAEDGDDVLNWLDQSSTANHTSQSSSSHRPIFRTNQINFNPAIDFDETNNERLDVASNIYTTTNFNFTGFYVYDNDDTNFILANSGGPGIRFYLFPGRAVFGTDNITSSSPSGVSLNTATHSSGTGGNSLNGETTMTASTGTWSSTATGWKVGGYGNASDGTTGHHYDGRIAEIALYSATLTATEIRQVESYLGLKYGITLDNSAGGDAGDYLSSASATLWDASVNSTYHNEVFGIIRDNGSDLHQKQSRTSLDATGLIAYHGAVGGAFPATNEVNSNALTNSTSIIFGHDNGATGHSLSFAGGNRMTRVYQAVDNGGVGTVTLYFDNTTFSGLSTGNTYYLVTSSDEIIDGSDQTAVMTEDGSTGNYYIEIDLDNNTSTYFTISENPISNNPGGISSNLEVWLRADVGTSCNTGSCSVSSWADQSSNAYSYTQGTGGNQPSFVTGDLNFNPGLSFNGSTHHMDGPDLSSTKNLSVFSVISQGATSGSNPVFGEVTATSDKQFALSVRVDSLRYDAEISSNDFVVDGGTAVGTGGRLIGAVVDNSLGVTVRLDGASDGTGTIPIEPTNTSGNSTLATWDYNSTFYNGTINEVIMYTSELTGTDLQRVESYMALKYGIHLSNSAGGTAGDYLASDATVVWDASANATYHNDVFGLVRDDGSALHQRQSRSENDATGLAVYHGSGFAATFPSTNDGNTNSLNDDQFLIVGHDNATVIHSTTAFGGNRMSRVYQAVDHGATGTVTLYFDNTTFTGLSTGNTYYLITSDDAILDGTDLTTALTEDGSSGNFYIEVDFNDNTSTWFSISEVPFDEAPAGISSNLDIWLRADQDVEEATNDAAEDGDDVVNWLDQSSTANHTSQSSSTNRPVFRTNQINFNPAVDFTEANNDRLDFSSDIYTTTGFDFTGFYVYDNDDGGQILQNAGFAGERFYLTSSGVQIGTNTISGTTPSGPAIKTATHSGGTAGHDLNGANVGSASTGTWSGIAATWKLGAYGGASNNNTGHHYDGRIAELILYSSSLSATETRQVESYLAIKYGITLDNSGGGDEGDYVTANNTTIWDASVNSSYHNEVIGIVRDDQSGLHQRQSRSSEDATGVAVYLGAVGASLPATNSDNANSLSDEQALIIGHDNASVTHGTSFFGSNRMTRLYRAVDNGAVGTVTLYFDNTTFTSLSTGNTYYLVTSSNATIDGSDQSTVMTEDGSTGNYYVEIDLDDNTSTYFTISEAPVSIAPGGVSSALEVWLKADAGTNCNTGSCGISSWTDQSTNGYSYTQGTGGDQPTYNLSDLNFNPSLSFNGSSHHLDGPDLSSTKNLSVFSVISQGVASGTHPVFGEVSSANDKQFALSVRTDLIRYDAEISANNFVVTGGSNIGTGGRLIGAVVDNSLGVTLRRDGASDGTGTIPSEPTNIAGNSTVGTWVYNSTYYNGNIDEVVMYTSELTGTDLQRVESYLALKYGLHLDNGAGGTAGDYLNSDATVIWDASANATYHNEVFGIGRDDASAFHQRQSRPRDDANGLTIYHGSGYAATYPTENATNTNDLTEKQFLVVGHDNGSVAFSTAVFGSNRMTRIFQAEDNGGVGTVTLYFDNTTYSGLSTGNTYYLVTSSDAVISGADQTTAMTEDGSTGNFYVEIDLNDNAPTWFTISDVDFQIAPAGISSNLDFWIRADLDVEEAASDPAEDGDDVVNWLDQSTTANHTSQSSSSNRPVYRTNQINFNPALDFDEANNDRLDIASSVYTSTNFNFTGFYVYDGDDTGFIIANNGGAGTRFYLNPGRSTFGTNAIFSTSPSSPSINTATHSSGTTGSSLNGEVSVTGATGTWSSTSASWKVGGYGNASDGNTGHHFDGRLAEVALYSTTLSASQVRQVESYLALKYGITLNNAAGGLAGDYVTSSSTTVWDASVNSSYHNQIIGVIRDDLTLLHQRQSRSSDESTSLAVYHGAVGGAFPTTNEGNSNDLTDETSLVIGHDNASVAFATAFSGGNRMTRLFKAEDIGGVGTVTLYFDNTTFTGLSTGNTYYLVTSSDDIIDGTDQATVMVEDGVTGNFYVEVDLDDNTSSYFTISEPAVTPAPGGVTSSLEVWLKADAGTNCNTGSCAISSWTDQSSNAYSYTQGVGGDQPTFLTEDLNFQPALVFNGTSHHLEGPDLSSTKNLSVFSVIRQGSTSGFHPVFQEVTDGNDKQFALTTSSNLVRYDAEISGNNFSLSGSTALGTDGRLIGTVVDNSLGFTLRVDGASDGTGTIPSEPSNAASTSTVGTWDYNGTFYSGNIGEVVMYDTELTGTDLQRVESYLALKYGLHLNSGAGGTAGDYLSADGTVIWDASVNATYHNEVFGIGRDDLAAQHQRQSRSEGDASGLVIYHGSGYAGTFPTNNAANTNSLTENQFLITGHDNAAATLSTAFFSGNRMTRIYQVVDNGSVGTVTLYFDNSTFTSLSTGNTYYLITSADASIEGTDFATVMTEDGSTGNYYVEIDFNDNTSTFFTISDTDIDIAPGGIAGNLNIWLRADIDVEEASSDPAEDGDDVVNWLDQSTSANHTSQSSSSNRPVYRTNQINFNPAVDFIQTNNDRLDFDSDIYTTTGFDFTGFYVFDTDDGGQILQNGGSAGVRFYLTSSGIQIGTNSISGSTPGGPSLKTATHSGGTASHFLDGASVGSASTGTWSSTAVNWKLGAYGNASNGNTGHHYDGRIAEVALYNTSLSATETRQVESYLALKYGITLDNGAGGDAGDYVNAAGTTIWDASVNSSYHNEVIGVIRDDNSGLNQKQSRSVEDATGLAVYHGAVGGAFPTTNESNGNTITNEQSMIIGHDNASVALATSFLSGNRMTRIFQAEDNGGMGTVTLYFDNTTFTGLSTGNTYYLIRSSDDNFTIADQSFVMTEDGSTGNYYIEIDFNDNVSSFFTIADQPIIVAPGAVSSGLEVWLRADNGTNCTTDGCSISTWSDQSPNAYTYTQASGGNQPTLDSNSINFNPSLTFNGSTHHLDGPSIDATRNLSIIAVVQPGSSTGFHPVFSEVTDAADKQFALATSGNRVRYDAELSSNNYNATSSTDVGTEAHMIGTIVDNSLGLTFRLDGESDGTSTLSAEPTNTGVASTVGTWDYNTSFYNGQIAEVVMYDTELTGEDLQKVESYLAIKYGLTLSNDNNGNGSPGEAIGSNGEGDYLSSDGTVIWDYSANTSFHNDVAGIGQDDGSNYLQTASQSINSGSILRIENPSAMTDGEYFMIGHNGGNAQADEVGDVPSGEGVQARLSRVWMVEENAGDVGTVDLVFDDSGFGSITLTDIRLLIDKDGDGNFNDETASGGGVISGAVAGSVKFENINLADGESFTLGTINFNNTPLPVELLSFNAHLNREQVDLKWETATEINNDYFIVERSRDGNLWETVLEKDGAGNSSVQIEYFDIDPQPYSGISYYRLTQVDFNGDRETFNIVPIENLGPEEEGKMSIFPNPVRSGQPINVEFSNLEGEEVLLVIRDLAGRQYHAKMLVIARDQEIIAIDELHNIPPGTYLIVASSNNALYSKKVVVQ